MTDLWFTGAAFVCAFISGVAVGFVLHRGLK